MSSRRWPGYWLDQGLAGFRVDAVPFLLEPTGMPEGAIVDPHELLSDLRRHLGRRRGDAILLGEVNLPPPDLRKFFGDEDGDELHMAFNFPVNQAHVSRARPGRGRTGEKCTSGFCLIIPEDCQWANFVRNHDELTLDRLTEDERAEVFARLRAATRAPALRPRPAPAPADHAEGDQRRMRMVYSLAFSLPGTPVLFYGEEIGMAENLAVEGRMSVRSPMQWSSEPEGGFTTNAEPVRPVVADDGFGPPT